MGRQRKKTQEASSLLPTTRFYSTGSAKRRREVENSESDSISSNADDHRQRKSSSDEADESDEDKDKSFLDSSSIFPALEWAIGGLLLIIVVIGIVLYVKSNSAAAAAASTSMPTPTPLLPPSSPPPVTPSSSSSTPTSASPVSMTSKSKSKATPTVSGGSGGKGVIGSYSPVPPLSGGPTGWTATTVNVVTPSSVAWNTAVTSASPVPGFKGVQGPGIGSWFHTNSTEDSTNGHSWCYFPYFDNNPGFAPDIYVMTSNGALTVEEAGPLYCGLEAIVTAPNGNQMTMYILDAFDHKWVKDSGAIDIIYDSFTLLHGSSPGTDKDTVMMGVTWELTGNRLVAATFNKGGLGSKKRMKRLAQTEQFSNSSSTSAA